MARMVSIVGALVLFFVACGSDESPGPGGGGAGSGGSGGTAGAGGTGGGAGGTGGQEEGGALTLPTHPSGPIAVPLHGHVGVLVQIDRERAGDAPIVIEVEGELPAGVWLGTSEDDAPGTFESLELGPDEETARLYLHSGTEVEALDEPKTILLRGRGGGWEEEFEAEVQVSALVTHRGDDGPGSLRDMIESAPALRERPTIGFAPWIFAQTSGVHRIVLESTLPITKDLELVGPHDNGRPLVVLDGEERIRLIEVGTEAMATDGEALDVRIAHLRFEKGKVAGDGGCILNHLGLELEEVVFSGCIAERTGSIGGYGGAVSSTWPASFLRIFDSHFQGNRAWTGGALAVFGKAEIEGTDFVENHAESTAGAAQFWTEEEVSVKDCLFERNEAQAAGAAGFVDGGNFRVHKSRFIGNAAVRGDSGGGGAIYTEIGTDDSVHISESLFRENSGKYKGGAIMHGRGRLVVESSTFIGNEAHSVIAGAASMGGAIHSSSDLGDNLILSDTLFRGNKAETGGAIHADGNLVMNRCSVIENVAEGWAGGIDIIKAERAEILNSTIANNEALVVGGLYVHLGAKVDLAYVTITGNRATGEGNGSDRDGPVGGLALANASLTMARSIVAGNEATGDTTRDIWVEPRPDKIALFESGGYNLVGDTHGSAKLLAPVALLDPSKGDLSGNRSQPAGVLDLLLEDLAEVAPRVWVAIPREESDAVDRIPLGMCAAPAQVDQRGAPRPSGEGCDSGAVER